MNEFLARIGAGHGWSPRLVGRVRVWAPVGGATVFLALWIVAESGRLAMASAVITFAAWALVVALSGRWPLVSIALAVVIPIVLGSGGIVLQFIYGARWSDQRYTVIGGSSYWYNLDTAWPVWFAAPLAVAWIALTRETRLVRGLALAGGLVSAGLYSALLIASGWMVWTGQFGLGACIELLVSLCATVVFAWLLGLGLSAIWRVRVVTGDLETTAAKLDEADLELRLAHDRGRISRDIHDSLAHSLAVIVAQAEGAAAIHELRPEAAPESLSNISTVARHALAEVRRLVERITDDDDLSEHTSRIEHIPALVDELRQAGVDATLRVLGDLGPLALSKQVAVFRIVQESLTNALKHGGRGSAATVTLDAQGAGLAVLIVSKSGGGEPLVNGGGRGIGIAGMKERARLVGGWLTAVPSDDETFVVTAFIPPDSAVTPDEAPQAPASDELIEAESETAALAIEGAHD
ncbi:sensor histidine kinase [Gryllotalpicola koreensis]|uniref:histidine kinase n=1 Tax=Gryllotalpicola koreensis TaxID=993086 RepID=A0ABP8A2Y6_9MICO